MCVIPFLYTRKKKIQRNKVLFFDARVTMKERPITRCRKRACIFHLILVGLPTRLILIVMEVLTNN